jgi:hypothetical protein
VEIPASLVDFWELVTEDGLHLDYLNGNLCSTYVERKEGLLVFDTTRFEEDRGSPEVFLDLPKESLMGLE